MNLICRGLGLLTLQWWLGAAVYAADACAPAAPFTFICNVPAAEDVVAVPGTAALVASGIALGQGSSLKWIDIASDNVQPLYPRADADALDAEHFPDCQQPPTPATFSTHGLALAPLSVSAFLLYAAYQGERNSIEVFELTVQPTPHMLWRGCILLAATTPPNAVAVLPNGAVAIASMDDGAADRMQRHLVGEPMGRVQIWQMGSGLRPLPNLRLRGGNGIVASADGASLFVSAWASGEIVRIDSQSGLITDHIVLNFLPDNLKWTSAGHLLVGGQLPPLQALASCTGDPCPADWLIADIDPISQAVTTLATAKGSALVQYATGAARVGDMLYISNRGAGRLAVLNISSAHQE